MSLSLLFHSYYTQPWFVCYYLFYIYFRRHGSIPLPCLNIWKFELGTFRSLFQDTIYALGASFPFLWFDHVHMIREDLWSIYTWFHDLNVYHEFPFLHWSYYIMSWTFFFHRCWFFHMIFRANFHDPYMVCMNLQAILKWRGSVSHLN